MKYLLLSFFVVLCFQSIAQDEPFLSDMGIVPAPVSVKRTRGEFKLTPETFILSDATTERGVKLFMDFLTKAGYGHRLTDIHNIDKSPASLKNSITLSINYKDESKPEGYEILITEDRVILNGKGAGLFYGVQTLMQLLKPGKPGFATLPCGTIKDYPRFGYRGMHLDVARHFFDVAFIKKYIDVLAAYKINYFHWHLTDDQGWRIEIKKYPNLTAVGSKRAQTKVGKMSGNDADLYDNTPYGGYYTQEEVKDIVAYAQDRYVNIIPEIEMPGHCLAALASYPDLGCEPDKGYKVGEGWGVTTDVYCPTDHTFEVLQDVLREVVDLFPCKYVHIGGDECPKDAWKKSQFCQNLIREQRMRDENELQSYFIARIEKYLNLHNRVIIGWDEILEGGVAPNATVMSWRGEAGGIAAAQLNHDVIMTPGEFGMYFDHAQSKSSQEPLNIGGFAPTSKTYNYDPVPSALNSDQAKHVIGVQANLWTEYIATPEKAEYMLLPRMLALAEVAWSPTAAKNYRDFSENRLPHNLRLLEQKGYNFRVPEPIGMDDSVKKGSSFHIELKTPVEGGKIHYTIDGYTPTENDLSYTGQLRIKVPDNKKIDFQTITVTPGGKRSVAKHTILDNSGN